MDVPLPEITICEYSSKLEGFVPLTHSYSPYLCPCIENGGLLKVGNTEGP